MSRTTEKGIRLLVAAVLAVFGLCGPLSAQEVTVHGTVLDAQEQPIPGASVTVQGTTTSTTTDAKGEFAIIAPNANSTLVISFTGLATAQLPLNGRSSVVVHLSPSAVSLDELVVVGYGTQKKSDVTGAITSVNTQRLEETPSTSVAQALQGVAPGVSVTQSGGGAEANMSILIRGRNSITANNDPLIVIDGIPYNGTLSEINQSDIASIDILKDASAAAIYGSRGSNGVVLITTRKGGGGKPKISYDGYMGMQNITNVPEVMNGAQFAQFKCDRLSAIGDCNSVLTATEQANLAAGKSTDWMDLAMRTGTQQQHTLSVAGGTEGTRYYVAGSLLDVNGVAKNDEFGRYSLRVNLDQKVKSWLNLGTSTQMSQVDRSGVPANFEDAFFMNPLTNPFNADGTQTIYPWPEDIFWSNPLQGILAKDSDISRRVFTSNFVQADLPFVKGLSYRLNAGLDFASREQGRYWGRNTQEGLETRGSASVDHSARFDWTLENVLRYQRSFGDHSLDFTALYSQQGNNLESQSLDSEGFPNDVLTYHQANVATLVVPSDNVTDSRLISQMGRLNYSYADRYLLTLTARRDGFSGFGQNHKWGVFPSLALGWNVSNESFWAPLSDKINSFKLRASYGKNGNQAISPYQTLSRLDDFSYLDGSQTAPGYIPSTLGNPDLKWETTTQLNVGADFGFWDDRLRGSLDVYRSHTSDLLLNRLISPVHGVTRILENLGKTQNRGVELQLSSINMETPSFTWTTNFNISANRNKIVDLYGNGENDVANGWFIGMPIDVTYDYKFGGIWQEGDDIADSAQPTAVPGDVKVVDVNGDGKITPDDRTFLGKLEPTYTAGLVNTFSYKGLSLTSLFNSVQGVERENALLGTNLVHAEVRRNTIPHEFWTPENPINTYPRNNEFANPMGVGFLEDASYIRLKDLTLSYDIPSSLTDRLGTESLRLYIDGRNLWTHTKWSGLDPELSNQRGVPLERVFIGGINVRF
jgi:TonB-linked SusC/RagA family outer membrane protein